MNIIKKILLFFTREKFSAIYHVNGTWKIKYTNSDSKFDEYCSFTILKSNKNRYRLMTDGYKPKEHSMYEYVFKTYRKLVEGKYYIDGGEVFIKLEHLTLEECEEKLKKALETENYELADKIKKIIENKRK